MKSFLLLFSLLFSTSLWAESTAIQYLERMEKMVHTGVITSEAARQVKLQEKTRNREARKEAQRELASVHPDLKPLQLKRLKVAPMILFID